MFKSKDTYFKDTSSGKMYMVKGGMLNDIREVKVKKKKKKKGLFGLFG